MNKIIVFLILFLSSFSAFADKVEYGSDNIELSFEYVHIKARVACITKYHPYTEGEEFSELFFMDDNDYKKYLELVEDGYESLKTLRGGKVCATTSKDMPNIGVGLYDKKDYIKAVIEEEKGDFEGTVVMIRSRKLFDDLHKQKNDILTRILK